MKVIDNVGAVRFTAGDTVAPEDINRVFNYAADAIDDVSEKRYAICAITFPFVDDMATPITNASTTNLKYHRFVCPVDCMVLRAFVDGNMTTTVALNPLFVLAGTGTSPQGGTNPLLSIPIGAVVANDVNDINVQRMQLVAGQAYDILLNGTGFNAERLDVTLHVAVDRWMLAGAVNEPAFTPTRVIDEVTNAVVVAANIAAANTEAAKFSARGMACCLLLARNFHSATPATNLTFALPTYLAARANARIVRAYLSASATAAGTVTATVRNAAAAVVATLVNAGGTSLTTVDSGALNIPINAGNPSLSAQDFNVDFTATQVSPQVCQRAALLVWFEW